MPENTQNLPVEIPRSPELSSPSGEGLHVSPRTPSHRPLGCSYIGLVERRQVRIGLYEGWVKLTIDHNFIDTGTRGLRGIVALFSQHNVDFDMEFIRDHIPGHAPSLMGTHIPKRKNGWRALRMTASNKFLPPSLPSLPTSLPLPRHLLTMRYQRARMDSDDPTLGHPEQAVA